MYVCIYVYRERKRQHSKFSFFFFLLINNDQQILVIVFYHIIEDKSKVFFLLSSIIFLQLFSFNFNIKQYYVLVFYVWPCSFIQYDYEFNVRSRRNECLIYWLINEVIYFFFFLYVRMYDDGSSRFWFFFMCISKG